MAVQEFISPTSLSEAQKAVRGGAVSSWLAGGTDLLVGIRLGTKIAIFLPKREGFLP